MSIERQIGRINKKDPDTINLDIGSLDRVLSIDFADIKAIQACGLDAEKMIDVWRASDSSKMEVLMGKNVKAMKSLEAKVPGGAKILVDEFGIYNFARYPREILIKQIREKDEVKMPYGTIITAYFDHNDAFLDSDWRHVLTKLNMILGKDYALRITECGDVLNFARSVGKFEKRYGAHQKLTFALLSGHGNETQFDFGKTNDTTHFITAEEIDLNEPKIARRFKKYENCFAPEASLILDSCAGGAVDENAIAMVLSNALHRRVYAAVGQGSICDIEALVYKDGVSFFPHYSGAETHEINPE